MTAGTCITAASEPHFHSGDEYPTFTSALRTFVESGGNFLAQCGGISTYENCDRSRTTLPDCENGLFMTDRGLNIVSSLPNQQVCAASNSDDDTTNNQECPSVYRNSDTPVAQFTGDWGWYSGSVRAMTLWKYVGMQ